MMDETEIRRIRDALARNAMDADRREMQAKIKGAPTQDTASLLGIEGITLEQAMQNGINGMMLENMAQRAAYDKNRQAQAEIEQRAAQAMGGKLTARQQLDNLANAMIEDIMSMSDDEILAECLEDGRDPEEIATQMRAILERAIAQVNKEAQERDHLARNYGPDSFKRSQTPWDGSS